MNKELQEDIDPEIVQKELQNIETEMKGDIMNAEQESKILEEKAIRID